MDFRSVIVVVIRLNLALIILFGYLINRVDGPLRQDNSYHSFLLIGFVVLLIAIFCISIFAIIYSKKHPLLESK